MTNPYHPTPRKLERSRTNKMFGGVCGGLAEYLNMDPTLVRILTVLISLFTGVPVLLYLIALFVIPEEGSPTSQAGYPPVRGGEPTPSAYSPYSPASGDPVWGSAGAPWEQPAPEPAPAPTPPAPKAPTQPAKEVPNDQGPADEAGPRL
jgi:phage shock protein PspC (stress-responsive transcriptional regulator)